MSVGRWWTHAAAVLGALSLMWVSMQPTRASGGSGATYAHPTWWAKYQVVSTKPQRSVGATTSVKVGPNIDVSNEAGPQSETAIAINPANPSQIVAGSNEIDRLPMRGYYSSDGGKTYGAVDLPLPPPLVTNGFDFGSDPAVAWDTHGTVYYSYIVVFFSAGGAINGTEMAVARSSDGGKSWTATYFNVQTGEAQFNDKPYIAVDTGAASPFLGTVYVAWDNATGNASSSNAVLVSRSTDGGRTFSAPVYASNITTPGPKAVIGADPVVNADGSLAVAWDDIQNSRIAASTSTDGGTTFGPSTTIAPTAATYQVLVPAMAVRGALIYPACGADTSAGAFRGTLYCSWMDETVASGTDILLARSTDRGATWSAPVRVNDDPLGVANDQFNQWLAVDATTGAVHLSWNDTRNDPQHLSTDVYYARSTDGGRTVGANVRVTTAPTNETCCGAELFDQYGDYEGIAAYGGTVHPVWTDRRSSVAALDEEVFTATLLPR